jgi:RNA polymerase sigma-70 factor (ECF subfamily)
MRVGDAKQERFELLYAAHYDRVLAYTLFRASVDGARDAAAETFLVAWRRIDDVLDAPLPWLIGVARRCLADQRRSAGRREALRARLHQGVDAPDVWDDDPGDAAVERDRVVAALRRLPALDRELLRLVAWDGLSRAQAAQSLGCTRAAFAVRLHRARRRLVSALDAQEASAADVAPATRPDRPVRFGALAVSAPLSVRPEEAS